MNTKVTLPKLGESIVSATVVQWFKKVGDTVRLDEPLLEVATDKVNSEIPSPVAGVLTEICAQVDEELPVGGLLAVVSQGEAPEAQQEFLTPAVLRLLRDKGIQMGEIDKIPRTGEGGRLSKKDVENYTQPAPAIAVQCPLETERVKMTPMRKAIADNMVKSFYEAPHATLASEVDVTQILKVIQEKKKAGVKLTITAFVARGIAQALQEYPLLNASLEGDTIVMRRFVNLGIAVSVDQGLMVPVLKNCQEKTLEQVAHEIGSLAEKTRSHKLLPDDVKDGTITLTNFGMTGITLGIPIIRYPEVAIVGLGAISKKVLAMPDDSIAIRSVVMVSLTFDHRVLDGIYGCNFLNTLKKHLEAMI